MIGQTKSYSKHQDIVDRFLEETDPYTPSTPISFDLHGYLNYVSEYHIDDPDTIPSDVMKLFFENEKDSRKLHDGSGLYNMGEAIRRKAEAEGRAEGRAEGENLFAALITKLKELGRTEDAFKAAEDKQYREKLYKEFQLA